MVKFMCVYFIIVLKSRVKTKQENPKKSMPRHTIKLPKTKDKEARKNTKEGASRKRHMTYRKRTKMTTAFSPETTEDRRKWQNIFKVPKELSVQNSISNKNTLRE